MEALITILIPLLFIISIVGFIFWLARIQYARREKQLKAFAEKRQLYFRAPTGKWRVFSEQYPAVYGKISGRDFELSMYQIGSGKSARYYSFFSLSCSNPQQRKLSFYREGLFSKVKKLLGDNTLTIGDPDFDNQFTIKSSNQGFIRELFSPDIKRRLLELRYILNGEIRLTEDKIEYHEGGLIEQSQLANFERLVPLHFELAEQIEKGI